MSSDEAIREVLIQNQEDFSDRPPSLRAEILLQNHDVVFGNNTPTWNYIKKHMLRAMKLHGDGLQHLESFSLQFGMEMLAEIEKHCGNAFDPSQIIRLTTGSIIMVLTYGYSTHADVNTFADIERVVSRLLQPQGLFLLLDIFPWLTFLLPQVRRIHNDVLKLGQDIEQTFRRFLTTRKQNINKQGYNVYIDHFLNLFENCDSGLLENKNVKLDEQHVIFAGADLLIAGISTTYVTLYTLLGILVNHPSIQDTAYHQISEIIGKRPPNIEDRQNLPFLEATLLEAHRYITLNPVLVPHYCALGSKIKGYKIPPGTLVLPNVWSLHHNPDYWESPWMFNPYRFLEDGKLVAPDHINRQRVMMFSAGKRKCPGEIFAKNRLFILLTLMLQKFKFLPAEGHPRPKHDPREYDVRLALIIKPYKLSAQLRK